MPYRQIYSSASLILLIGRGIGLYNCVSFVFKFTEGGSNKLLLEADFNKDFKHIETQWAFTKDDVSLIVFWIVRVQPCCSARFKSSITSKTRKQEFWGTSFQKSRLPSSDVSRELHFYPCLLKRFLTSVSFQPETLVDLQDTTGLQSIFIL